MKLQSMSLRRIMACVLSLLMIITALPLGVSASGGGGDGGGDTSGGDDKPLTVTADKYIVGKDGETDTATPADADEDGNYTVRIDVKGGSKEETITPNADVILILDNSGSMSKDVAYGTNDICGHTSENFIKVSRDSYICPECGTTYGSNKNGWDYFQCSSKSVQRMPVAKDAATLFADNILTEGSDNRIAVINFNSNASVESGFTNDISAVKTAIKSINAWYREWRDFLITHTDSSGGTDYDNAFQEAYELIVKRPESDKDRPVYIVFLTDGEPDSFWSDGIEEANDIKKIKNTTIYTIGIGNIGNGGRELLQVLASSYDDAKFITDVNEDALSDIFDEFATEINTIYAGSDAVLTDVINTDYFVYVPDSLTFSDGTSAEIPDGMNIKWTIDDITDKVVSLEFKVKLKADYADVADDYYTNTDVYLNYKNSNKEPDKLEKEDIGHPCVNIPAPETYDITVVVKNGTSNVESPVTVVEGEDKIITFTANDGFALDTVTVDGEFDALEDNGSYTFEDVTSDHTIEVVYSEDNNKDGTPDKYQATVTYKVVNGTWNDGKAEEIIVLFYLKEKDNNGIWVDLNPTLGESIPEGMKPSEDYTDNGTWDAIINSNTPVTENVTYTYTFPAIEKDTVTSIELHVQTADATKPYDKTPLTKNELVEDGTYVVLTLDDGTKVTVPYSELTINEPTTVDGNWIVKYSDGDTYFEWEIDITGYQTIEGFSSNTFNHTLIKNIDSNSEYIYNEDLTPEVWPLYGILEITDATVESYNITITSGSKEKIYDEDPLIYYDYLDVKVTTKLSNGDDGNIDDNKLSVAQNPENPSEWRITYLDNGVTRFEYVVTINGSLTGTIDNVTTADNTFTYERTTANLDEGVTVNVEENYGTLTVNPKGDVVINFKAEEGGKLYLGGRDIGSNYDYTVKSAVLTEDIADAMLPTAVADEGYIFYGWFIADNRINDKNGLAQPEIADVADAAEWTARTYVAKFYKDPNYETEEEKDARTIEHLYLDIISGSAQKEFDDTPLYERTKLDAVLRADLKDGTTIVLPITVTKNSEDPTDGEWTITYFDNTYPILSFEIGIYGEQTNIDTSDNEFYVTAINETEEDLKGNYDYIYPYNLIADEILTINKEYGKLTVTSPIPVEAEPERYALTIYSGDAEKEYDGSPLTCDKLSDATATLTMDDGSKLTVKPKIERDSAFNYTVTIEYKGTVLVEHKVKITGSQTRVGSSDNLIIQVDHYQTIGGTIGYKYGTLTVTEEDDDGGIIILPAGFLYIENNVIAPDGFAKDEFTYEVYDNNTGKLIETVTIDANDRSRGVMFAYNTEVYVVPVDMEVEGYNLVTTSDPSDATDDVYVSQDTTIEFTHVYTVQLNTEDHYAYIIGYEDGTVRPQGLITRAEVATIFYRLLSDEARAAFFTQDNNYVDVASDAWYNNAISTMTNAGLFNGYPNGTFNPDGPITRAELVKVAASFFGSFEPGTSVFSDTDGHWASDFIDEAYVLGIVNGYTDGTFKPNQYITRAEAMKIVNGILGRDSVTGDLIDDMVIWSDNLDPDAWYYYIVQEATNSHEYVIDNDEETWTAALPNRDWSELEKVDTEM